MLRFFTGLQSLRTEGSVQQLRQQLQSIHPLPLESTSALKSRDGDQQKGQNAAGGGAEASPKDKTRCAACAKWIRPLDAEPIQPLRLRTPWTLSWTFATVRVRQLASVGHERRAMKPRNLGD